MRMRYLDNEVYRRDIKKTIEHVTGFEKIYQKSVLILGASGLIGSFLTDCFLYANEEFHAGIVIYAVSRSGEQLKLRFGDGCGTDLHLIEADVTISDIEVTADYIIDTAGYGHPGAFRVTPVEVLLSNVIGLHKVLDLARRNTGSRVLYVSSGEVQEQVEHLSVRACYPIGKRAAETLCISYRAEYDVDVVIARPCHTFGANITKKDNRATAQFITAAARGIDIEMYSEGTQKRSFSYVGDCVSGLLSVLFEGESGKVYGISSGECCSVREFADRCAYIGRCRVKMHEPTVHEKVEVSPIKDQIVENVRLKELGWQPAFSIMEGLRESIGIMREMRE